MKLVLVEFIELEIGQSYIYSFVCEYSFNQFYHMFNYHHKKMKNYSITIKFPYVISLIYISITSQTSTLYRLRIQTLISVNH